MRDHWINPCGYDDPLIPREGWWEQWVAREVRRFTLVMSAPLTLCCVDGDVCNLWQPPMEFESDGASIPRMLTILPGYSRTAYEPAPYLHDGEHAQRVVFHARVPLAQIIASRDPLEGVQFAREQSHAPAANERYRRALLASGCPWYRAEIQKRVLDAVGVRW